MYTSNGTFTKLPLCKTSSKERVYCANKLFPHLAQVLK